MLPFLDVSPVAGPVQSDRFGVGQGLIVAHPLRAFGEDYVARSWCPSAQGLSLWLREGPLSCVRAALILSYIYTVL